MLKKFRVVIASFFLIAVTLLFLDFTGTLHNYLGWTAKVQYVPAMLAASVFVVAGLLITTVLFGRIYCSTVCPLGVYQDKASRVAGLFKKNRFAYRPPKTPLVIMRYALLLFFVVALIAGVPFVAALLEPYSAYGRMISQTVAPLYKYGNNILAGFAERAGSFAFSEVDVWMTSAAAFAVAILTFVTVTIFAAKSGRGYCNTICPVGALLGIINSIFKIRLDANTCNKCGLCAKNCKSGCIDATRGTVDHTRCVVCFNCMYKCPKKCITFSAGKLSGSQNSSAIKKSTNIVDKSNVNRNNIVDGNDVVNNNVVNDNDVNKVINNNTVINNNNANINNNGADDNLTTDGLSRRNMIVGAALLAAGSAANAVVRTYDFDGGLAPVEPKQTPPRQTPIIPPGAQNIRNFSRRCTGCQLCVSACPNNVLRPSNELENFMQPHLSFERGFCRPECVKCSQVCPTGAILPITTAEKSSTQIGYAIWNRNLCVVNVDNVQCDLCERRCPTGAITRIPRDANDESSLKIPMIDPYRCTGCGSCEHHCPSRPISAIYVEGVESHRMI